MSNNNLVWGQRREEDQRNMGLNMSVPNPAFAVKNVSNEYSEPAIFTASTTVGVDSAMKILGKQAKLSPEEVQDTLMPWQEVFEDITSWQGDKDPSIGNNPNVGLTQYRARQGEVIRRYDRLEPGLGRISLMVNSLIYNGTITTNVKFA